MTFFLVIIFACMCAFLVGWGLLRPGRLCEFPFLAGATFAGFVLPQTVGIIWNEPTGPPGFDRALLMCIFCAGMSYLGYVVSGTPTAALRWELDSNRLLAVSAGLSVLGAFFFFLIRRLPNELVATGGWTGLPVAYYFFAQVLRYGFALALLLYLGFRSKWALAVVLFDSIFLLDWIVIRARRGFAIEIVLALLCAFWFVQRRSLPRWGALVMLAAGVVGVGGAAAYRAAMYQDQGYGGTLEHEIPWQDLMAVDYMAAFVTYHEEESHEFRNLAYIFDVTDTFDYGLSYWNEFIYVFVPAQVLGSEFKESLQFDLPGEVTDPNSPGGTTITGMGDSYQAFGWFGCLVFFLMAYLMRKIFETAQAGHLAAQLVYMLVITSMMHTITHHTKWFVTGWVHMSVFVLPCLLWARKPAVVTDNEPLISLDAARS